MTYNSYNGRKDYLFAEVIYAQSEKIDKGGIKL